MGVGAGRWQNRLPSTTAPAGEPRPTCYGSAGPGFAGPTPGVFHHWSPGSPHTLPTALTLLPPASSRAPRGPRQETRLRQQWQGRCSLPSPQHVPPWACCPPEGSPPSRDAPSHSGMPPCPPSRGVWLSSAAPTQVTSHVYGGFRQSRNPRHLTGWGPRDPPPTHLPDFCTGRNGGLRQPGRG